MTTVTSTTPTPTATDTKSNASMDKLLSDKTMFLKLLTTQMQNQDPLNPMDTSQYTQQLVQFSQVEQSIQQTGALNDILAKMTGQDLVSASSLVGKTGAFDSEIAGFSDGAPASWSYAATGAPTEMVATVLDAKGNAVAAWPLDKASGTIQWDGKLADGGTAAEGLYMLSVKATDNSGGSVPVSVHANARIDEAMLDGKSVMLKGAAGATYPFGSLIGTMIKD